MHSEEEIFAQVEDILRPLNLKLEDYKAFCKLMENSIKMGLSPETNNKSSLKMYPSFVTKIPDRNVTGNYLSLDLGGTNYRILLVQFNGKGSPKIEERCHVIPKGKMSGSGKDLFEYIANTLREFLELHRLTGDEFKLGFTFSFPCKQLSLSEALLVKWTKGFTAEGVIGNNVAALLQTAINKAGLRVEVVAVVNDTVGTLASCALEDPKCAIGVILGTGTNAAYVEKIEAVPGVKCTTSDVMIINTEWGAFGENGEIESIRTVFDRTVDEDSVNPKKQLFEKMISGLYLGEIVRHILIFLVEKNLLFRGEMPELLLKKGVIQTKFLSEVERDPATKHYCTHYILTDDLQVPVVDLTDTAVVRRTIEVVCTRAANLAGAATACLMNRINRPEVTVGIDGSLYKFHSHFHPRMTTIIDQLKSSDYLFRLRISEDGSGKGAAAIAAATQH